MSEKINITSEDARARRTRQRRLGEQLKRIYDDVASEPVPDDFMKLLELADENDQAERSAATGAPRKAGA